MTEFSKKFGPIEKEIAQKMGEFEFFAILLREDAPDRWDVVAAAPWLKNDDNNMLEYLIKVIKKYLSNDIVRLSRIVVLENNNPALKSIHRVFRVNHGSIEVENSNLFGLEIKHGYIITSNKKPKELKEGSPTFAVSSRTVVHG